MFQYNCPNLTDSFKNNLRCVCTILTDVMQKIELTKKPACLSKESGFQVVIVDCHTYHGESYVCTPQYFVIIHSRSSHSHYLTMWRRLAPPNVLDEF